MSGEQNQGSGNNTIRALWVPTLWAGLAPILSVLLGRGVFDGQMPGPLLPMVVLAIGWVMFGCYLRAVAVGGQHSAATSRVAEVVLAVGLVATFFGFMAAYDTYL